MAQQHLTQRSDVTEEALTMLFCLVDDAYGLLNPEGARRYEGGPQAALGLGGHRPRALPATARRGERALLPA